MRLESEHTHYRTRFEMYARESSDDALPHVLQVMYGWLCDKERKLHPDGDSELLRRLEGTAFDYHVDHPGHVHGECRTSRALLEGMSCPNVYDGGIGTGDDAKLCSRSMTGGGEEGLPQYWAMDYDEPDGNIAARRWHTSVGIVSHGKTCVVSVRITNYLLPSYVGPRPSTPPSSTPNFVRKLIMLNGFRARIGSTVLSRRFTWVGNLQRYRDAFVKPLVDPARELPLIVVATDYEGEAPTDARDLAYKAMGMAKVLLLDLKEYRVRDYVRQTFVEGTPAFEHRVSANSVRVYNPGLNPKSAVDARRHRLFSREDIGRLGDGFNDMLVRSLTRGWVQDDEDVVDVLDVATRARRERNAELRRRLDELSRQSEERARERRRRGEREAGETVAELRQLLEERDLEIARLEEDNAVWHGMAEEYAGDLEEVSADAERRKEKAHAEIAGYIAEVAQKDEEIALLGDEVSQLEYDRKFAWDQVAQFTSDLTVAQRALSVYEGVSHIPGRLSELLEVLDSLYPDRVVVLDEARKSALAFDGKYDLDDEWAILRSVPTTLWDLYFGKAPSSNVQKDYQAATSFELALTEGAQTNKGAKYMKQRERIYRGQTVTIAPHIKGRSGNSNDHFRLHYYADTERKVIVIGHCGAHLETAGSSKAKH